LKKKLPFIALFLLIIGLIAWKYVHRPVKLEKQPIILGHGGMGVRSSYTLDSKRSVELALSFPIEGTEIDVRMTSDNVLIAYHDEELPVHTGCPGKVWEKTYPEMYECSHGVFHKAEPVDALDTLLSYSWKDGTIFSLDLKPEGDIDSLRMMQFQSNVNKVVNQFPQFRFLIESQDLNLLASLNKMSVQAELFYYAQDGETGIESVKKNQLSGISINASYITKQQISDAKTANITVMIWGTGSVFSNREFLGWGADIIQTDGIKSMVTLLDR
jgi:glycerophosphoryl diester phosphodiesterase